MAVNDAKDGRISHPPYTQMISEAIKELKERKGSSRQAITKFMFAKYSFKDETKAQNQIRLAIIKSLEDGKIKQIKGTGANGSFKLSVEEKETKAVKSKAKTDRKAPTKVSKKSAVKSLNRTISTPAKKKPASKSKSSDKTPKKGKLDSSQTEDNKKPSNKTPKKVDSETSDTPEKDSDTKSNRKTPVKKSTKTPVKKLTKSKTLKTKAVKRLNKSATKKPTPKKTTRKPRNTES